MRFLISRSSWFLRRRPRVPVLFEPRLISRRSFSKDSSSASPTRPSANGSSLRTSVTGSRSVYLPAILRICSSVRFCASSACVRRVSNSISRRRASSFSRVSRALRSAAVSTLGLVAATFFFGCSLGLTSAVALPPFLTTTDVEISSFLSSDFLLDPKLARIAASVAA